MQRKPGALPIVGPLLALPAAPRCSPPLAITPVCLGAKHTCIYTHAYTNKVYMQPAADTVEQVGGCRGAAAGTFTPAAAWQKMMMH